MKLSQIMEEVAGYHPRHVCVTGGEPLAQKNCRDLLRQLCDKGYQVSLETSGAMDISNIDTRVSRVVDIKTPASGENARNRLDNIDLLTRHDQIKFVICSHDDYLWAMDMIRQLKLNDQCDVLFSPAVPAQSPVELADWIVSDNAPVRFQMQLHKLLWNDEPGR